MKRVMSACICQTLMFTLKEDVPHNYALELITQEVAAYKAHLEKSRTQYKITDEVSNPDGSVMIKIIKQYNSSPVGDYLN